jgi:predicted HicB family RNase H-like nuclease
MAMNVRHYTYCIIWSPEDAEYAGLCAEFPSLSWLHRDQAKALTGIVRVVGKIVSDMEANGEAPPEPMSAKSYSGKFQVRIPPERHKALAMQAAEQGISLNRYVTDKLCA